MVEAKQGISLELLKWYLLSQATALQTKWILSGTSYPRLDEEDFLNLRIVIPDDYNEQLRIVQNIERQVKDAEQKEQEARQAQREAGDTFKKLLLK